MCAWSGPALSGPQRRGHDPRQARATQHGSTGSTGPLGCRRGAKMGSAPARATLAGLGRQPACRSQKRGGTRRSDELPAIEVRERTTLYSKNNSRKGEADEGAYEGQRLCGLAAVRINGTDNINNLRRAASGEDRLQTYIRVDERQRRETVTYAWTKGRVRDMEICVDEKAQTSLTGARRKAAPSQHRQAHGHR
jgi:hypothetical protein